MKTSIFAVILLLLVSSSTFAQDAATHEIGLRTSDFGSIGLVYKKQLRENTYRRYRLAFGNLTTNFVNSTSAISFSVGGAIGKEKRRNVSDKLQFIYGLEFIPSVGFTSTNSGNLTVDNGNGSTLTYKGSTITLVMPSVGLGFVLGAQYNINPKWYISAELIPTITASGTFGNSNSIYSFQAGFTSSSAGITGAYRF